MTIIGWAQIALVLGCALLLAVPVGRWLGCLAQGRMGLLTGIDGGVLRAAGVDPARGQGWQGYLLAMLAFNAAGFLLLYGLLRLQGVLPLNPQGFDGIPPYLAFNTAISFVTNTNWQAYSGEAAMSHLSQMTGLAVQNFLSAGTGIALAFAVMRAFAAGGVTQLGNFWADLTRVTLWLLLPGALIAAFAFIAMGVPQTLAASVTATTLAGGEQIIALGPVAFQLAIKHLGTNGGGFFGVNSLHPFEGPSALATSLQIILQVVIPFGLCLAFGRIVGDARQGRALLAVMVGFVLVATLAIYAADPGADPPQHSGRHLRHQLGRRHQIPDAGAGRGEPADARYRWRVDRPGIDTDWCGDCGRCVDRRHRHDALGRRRRLAGRDRRRSGSEGRWPAEWPLRRHGQYAGGLRRRHHHRHL